MFSWFPSRDIGFILGFLENNENMDPWIVLPFQSPADNASSLSPVRADAEEAQVNPGVLDLPQVLAAVALFHPEPLDVLFLYVIEHHANAAVEVHGVPISRGVLRGEESAYTSMLKTVASTSMR